MASTEYISDADLERILRNVIDLFLIPRFEELGMNASGQWKDNLEVRGSSIWGRNYTRWLQDGRDKNKKQGHKELAKWAYGMSNYNEEFKKWLQIRGVVEYGFQIAYKIAAEGTKAYPEGNPLLDVLNEQPTLDYIKQQASIIITDKVKAEAFKQLANFKTI